MRGSICIGIVFASLIVLVCIADAWSGHFEAAIVRNTMRRCGFRSFWGHCVAWRYYYTYNMEYRCSSGWTHNGDQNCNIAICNPPCYNGGSCVSPNWCKCLEGFFGPTSGCAFRVM